MCFHITAAINKIRVETPVSMETQHPTGHDKKLSLLNRATIFSLNSQNPSLASISVF